jgi:hypothetical protein
MADGVWTMTEEGEFELNEPYATMLVEARVGATQAWTGYMLEYLADHTTYEVEFLKDELLRRCTEDMPASAIVDEFVLEALSGDL